MLETTVDQRQLEGAPLSWSPDLVRLLGRDGRLWEIDPSRASRSRQTAAAFRPFSAAELRAQLHAELGERLEVTGTGHFLVAHPPGQGGHWAQRFEDLYASCIHYFAVRGFRPRPPQFPLVALVWPSQADFARYAASEGFSARPGLLGYYSLASNRITLYDLAHGEASPHDWRRNAATLIHEATHQTAFNIGVHSRYAPPPRWVAEGLGTLFEAPGVYDSRSFPHSPDRINRGRLAQFREYLARGRPAVAFVELVRSDRLFDTHPAAAYAEAWALTWFLVETRPQQYCQYLARTAAHAAFEPVSAQARLADFTSIFATDLRILDAQFRDFVDQAR
jgi:hypothetical protein